MCFYHKKNLPILQMKKMDLWQQITSYGAFSASARFMQILVTDLTVSHTLALEAVMFLCSVSSTAKACRQVLQTAVISSRLDQQVNETVQITSQKVT